MKLTKISAAVGIATGLLLANPVHAELLKVDMDTVDTIEDVGGLDLGGTSAFLVMGAFKGQSYANLNTMFGGFTTATQVADAFTSAGGFSVFDTAAWSEEGSDFQVNFSGDHTTVLDSYDTASLTTITYPIVLGIFKQSSLIDFSNAGNAAEFAVITWQNNAFPRGGQSAEGAQISLAFEYAAANGAYSLVAGSNSAGVLTLQTIPEPSTLGLVGLAVGLGLVGRRKLQPKA